MANASNVSIGACQVTYAGVDLGHTQDGVEVTYAPTFHDVQVDKYGDTIVEKYLMGEKLTAKVKLAEYTIPNLDIAIEQGTVAGATSGKLNIGHAAGRKFSTTSALLVLHPLRLAASDRSQDVVLYKAAVSSSVVIPHTNKNEKVLEVVFESIVDETRVDGQYLGLIGDSAN
jgi:hypothetical protein